MVDFTGTDNTDVSTLSYGWFNLRDFRSGFSDGIHGYPIPCSNGSCFGKVMRWPLASFSTVEVPGMALTGPNLKGFFGGFSDGTYNFALPCCNGAGFDKVVRWALASFGQVQDDAGHNSASSDGLISQPCEVSKLNQKAASVNSHVVMMLLSVIPDSYLAERLRRRLGPHLRIPG